MLLDSSHVIFDKIKSTNIIVDYKSPPSERQYQHILGLGFFTTSYFFLSFCTSYFFFKSKLQHVFYFFEKITH